MNIIVTLGARSYEFKTDHALQRAKEIYLDHWGSQSSFEDKLEDENIQFLIYIG